MYTRSDTEVMLFHTREAAGQFCAELEKRNFDQTMYQIIGPDDVPEYGRGTHAAAERPETGGFMDKISGFFGFGEEDRSKYGDLASVLEAKGLNKHDAEYYEQEVRSGSTLLLLRAGERIDEIRDLAAQGTAKGMEAGVATSHQGPEMELRKEVPEIERHEELAGEAQVGKRIVTEHETVDVPKTREELVIERHPAEGRAPASGDIDISEEESRTIPLMEEEVTVEKRPVVSEEADIGKRQVTEIERDDVPLRREQLEVEENSERTRGEQRRVEDEEQDRPAA